MYKKSITYEDYDGNKRTEDFYFNITKSELIEMENSELGGLSTNLQKILKDQDNVATMKFFKNLIFKAYGEKSADGRRFEKSEKLSKEFSETPAYDQFFMELSTDSKAASDFFNGIMPKDISSGVDMEKLSDDLKSGKDINEIENENYIKNSGVSLYK